MGMQNGQLLKDLNPIFFNKTCFSYFLFLTLLVWPHLSQDLIRILAGSGSFVSRHMPSKSKSLVNDPAFHILTQSQYLSV